jgi:multiple sugar transport system permease protein
MNQRTSQLVSRLLMHGILIVMAIAFLLPFAWLVATSFKTNEDVGGSVLLPMGDGLFGVAWDRLNLDGYRKLFNESPIVSGLLASTFLASVTAVSATLLSAMAGYALAKLNFKGRSLATNLVLAAVIIPGPLLLAPGFVILHQMGLLDSYWGLVLPAAAPAFGVFLFRQAAMSSVPDTLIEAARIDGCGEFRIFLTVALPLLRPMVGAFMLITFLGVWTNYIGPQVVLQSPGKFPLAVVVAQLRGTYYQEYAMMMAGTLVSVLPVLVLFLLLQREFISGLTSGAVKG